MDKMQHVQTLPMRYLLRSFLLCLFFIGAPLYTHASGLEVAGWIPYWRDDEGIKTVIKHLDSVDIVFPFAFTVTTDGVPKDQSDLSAQEWTSFIRRAQRNNIEIIPTIMWSDGESIHRVLSNKKSRKAHVKAIVALVMESDYDGIDIDYESKKSETKDYFSSFLKELDDALEEKMLTCTVEARTPPESLYRDVPPVINYANDYDAIGTYCDRVEIMAYDQQRADIKLNEERAGEPYFPVADIDWVRKVVELAVESIPPEKILLGISTYGYHYKVTVAPNWFKSYERISALSVPQILDIGKKHKVQGSRNKSGEMSFTYLPKDSRVKLSKKLNIPKDTPKGNVVAARALAHANKTGKTVTFNLAWYPDARSMKDKLDLAEEFDLRGVAFFKFDGDEDRNVWKYLK